MQLNMPSFRQQWCAFVLINLKLMFRCGKAPALTELSPLVKRRTTSLRPRLPGFIVCMYNACKIFLGVSLTANHFR
jgi:hypothetical protein